MTRLEQVVLLTPAVLGGVLAVLVTGAFVLPQAQQWQAGQRRIEELRRLQAELPAQQRQLEREQAGLARAEAQEDLVLQLIAGSGDLLTFLTQVDRLAASSGVELTLYEPQRALPVQSASTQGGSSRGSRARGRDEKDQQEAPKPPADPLQADGLRRQELLLSARGRFPQLLTFVRQLERLNVLVVQSNLQLALEEAKQQSGNQGAAETPDPKVDLKLNIALYGRDGAGQGQGAAQGGSQGAARGSAAKPAQARR